MKKHPSRQILVLILVALIFLTGCDQEELERIGPYAWIDAPLDEMILPLAPYDVVMHATHPGGVDSFEFYLDGVLLTEIEASQESALLFRGEQSWVPEGPGTYQIEVRALNDYGVWGEFALAEVTILGEQAAVYPEPESSAQTPSPTPSATATPSATPTPEGSCSGEIIIQSLQNSFCRLGSNPVFDAVGILMDQQEAVIVALNPSQTWAYIDNPSYPGENFCWVWMNKIQFVQGDPDCAEIKLDPPTPTPTNTPLPPTPGGDY